MTTRPYELLVCFAQNGSIRGASVRYITTVNGRDYEGDPIPLQGVDDPAFAAFAERFGAAAIAERDTARAELATMTAERDSLDSSLAAMTIARDEAMAARDTLAAQLAEAKEQIANKNAELAAASETIAQLQSHIQWNVRIIDEAAFLARITPAELLDLTISTDPTRLQIGQMLAAYRANDWPIMLDSPEMQQAVGYLQQSAAITAERAAELLRDSTREEAYKAGE